MITPALSDSILPGITRDSIIKLANHNGIECIEEKIDLEEMIKGYESGSISEAFGVGTAAAVANITSITHKNQKLVFKFNENGFAEKLKTNLQNIQFGRSQDPFGWRVKIN